ncbi:hypothetical protein HRM2_32800 [Desulforapulum autotrophicum HRM2]|uniref:Uncharacterized protein n=1 Tax=Desulforapulum autotrophicum (strain ATCC 43914 / DSM 3382 / VKM B-1955 / HRM2) TaxID=177437 RepID=C0QLQ4_DESAH|nr:hypothetical protein [Desulforapulum autotrophicum]ACN16358.1 hypothetical protein HRM2_32800 [Desulforapulum autotrophicum HRM2]
MAGIQEILTLLLIIIGIIFIPRIMSGGRVKDTKKRKKIHLSGRMRLSIILSIITPLVAALILKPWAHNFVGFILAGIIPVAAGWAAYWIISGFKNHNNDPRGRK